MVDIDICSVDFLNKRIMAFNYGKIYDNQKPAENLTDSIIKDVKITKLKQNGIQMHNLIRSLPYFSIG